MTVPVIKRCVSWDDSQQTHKKDEKRRIASVIFLTITQLTMSFDAVAQIGLMSLFEKYFNVSDSTAATFSTVANALSLVSMALLFFFGDRLPRKHLMSCSIALWLLCNILSLFSTPTAYWLFLLTRTISSACWTIFVVLSPVIISDMFKDESLGKALMLNSLANYLGRVISSSITAWFKSTGLPWQAGLIPGPILVMVLLLLLVIVMPAKRHHAKLRKGEYFFDAKNLLKNKSFVLLTIGASFTSFYFRAHGVWMPTLVEKAWNTSGEVYLGLTQSGVSTLNIIVELLGVIIGLPLLVWLAESMQYATGPSFFRKHGGYARAIPSIILVLTLASGGLSAGEMSSLDKSYIVLAVLTFFIGFAGSPIVTLVTQMILNVVPPKQKASSIALTRLVVSLLAGWSGELVGVLSDILRGGSTIPVDEFGALRKAFYILLAFLVVAALFYFALVKTYPEDVIRSKMLIDFEDEEMDDEVQEPTERKPLLRRQRSREPMRQRADTTMTLASAIMGSTLAGLSIGGLFLNVLVLLAIVHSKMMQLHSPVYIFAFATIVNDILMIFLHLLYFAPSCFLQDYLFPESTVETGRKIVDLLLMVCWYHGTLSHILIAINRFVTVIFYQYPIFTRSRVVVMALFQIMISICFAVMTQFIFPCCRLSFTYPVYTYTYLEIEGLPNYTNRFDLPLNSLASATPLVAYGSIAIVIYRANEKIGRGRIREYIFAIQFAIMALIYTLVWGSVRVMPLVLAGTDKLYLYGFTTCLTLCNTSTNAVVYLTNNSEIKKSLISLTNVVQTPSTVVPSSKIVVTVNKRRSTET